MKRASETTPKRHSIVPIVAGERRLRWGQVLGTGSRMSGDAQGPSREGRNEEVNEQICRESVVSSAPPASRSRCSAASWSLESLCLLATLDESGNEHQSGSGLESHCPYRRMEGFESLPLRSITTRAVSKWRAALPGVRGDGSGQPPPHCS
jgi:hypothetical protein